MRSWEYPRYVTVAEKRARAEKKLKQLAKNNPNLRPVTLQSRTIAATWWGKSWNSNLERYADYANRIERGRSYVRHNAVLDLQITPGTVNALVQGSAAKPYAVSIGIAPIRIPVWKAMLKACGGKMASLQMLLAGTFPEELAEIFMTKGQGLFPSPGEITLSCSCPDWAVMCKHVAAALYGIGARLDEDPNLFFLLRKADVNALITEAITDQTHTLLKKAEKKSGRVMETSDLSDLFGIDLAHENAAAPSQPPASAKNIKKAEAGRSKTKSAAAGRSKTTSSTPVRQAKTARADSTSSANRKKALRKNAKTSAVKSRQHAPTGKSTAEPAAAGAPAGQSACAWVESLIQRSTTGIAISELAETTGFDRKKIHNIIFRLKLQKKIKNVSRGIFIGTE